MLFDGLPESPKPASACAGPGRPRLREPRRDEVLLRPVDLDALIGESHPARLFWDYVCKADLRELEDAIKSRDGRPGHPAASPRLLLALWLYATSEGVGSARALADLCVRHEAYLWLCGGVSVNYHSLSDFRVDNGKLLDRLLTEHVAALASAGLIDLTAISHDGMRVRASAGAASFRRKPTVEERLREARALVEQLKREVDDAPEASRSRIRAAKERAARERAERLAAALAMHEDIAAKAQKPGKAQTQAAQTQAAKAPEAKREGDGPHPDDDGSGPSRGTAAKKEKKKEEPRVSTTDPAARVIKMADGGFRPGYNCQFSTAKGTLVIVGVGVSTNSSDRGLLKPALEQHAAHHGGLPAQCLADGGFGKNDDIEWAARQGVEVFCPPVNGKAGVDPYALRDDDGDGVAAWRARMKSEAGKAIYKERSVTECAHAHMRHRGLHRLTVRGERKVKAQVTLHALTHNIQQGETLRRKRAG
jgi:transposase